MRAENEGVEYFFVSRWVGELACDMRINLFASERFCDNTMTQRCHNLVHSTVNLRQEFAMSQQSTIEWTDATWNPVRGCTQITPGCAKCYAKTFAERFRGVPGYPYEQGFDLRLVPGKLAEPLRWKESRRIFVNSMSDLFHPDVPDDFIVAVAKTMQSANWHTFQVLTKRADRMCTMLPSQLKFVAEKEHIWWGVSVENRKHGLPRCGALRKSNASVKFLSVEPLLERLGQFELTGIDWVIVGGESGAGARPMDPDWVREICNLCARRNVPFFFSGVVFAKKKLGESSTVEPTTKCLKD